MKFTEYLLKEKVSEDSLNWKCMKCGLESPGPTGDYKKGATIKKECPICQPLIKRKTKHSIVW